MTTPDLKTIGFQGYVVAFIDFLGFGNRLIQLEKDHDVLGFDDKIQVELKKIERDLASFRSYIEDMYESFGSHYEEPPGAPIPEHLQRAWATRAPSKPEIQGFSDSVIIWQAVDKERPLSVLFAIRDMIFACGRAQLLMLADHQVAIRGGISVGMGMDIVRQHGDQTTKEIVSSSLVKAHAIEQDQAKFPRIVLDPELCGWLDSIVDSGQLWSKDEQPLALRTRTHVAAALALHEDRLPFIDFLGPLFAESWQTQPGLLMKARAKVAGAIDSELTRLGGGTNQKAIDKWIWLERYRIAAETRYEAAQSRRKPS